MLDNEYVTLYSIRERIREAEAKGAFHAMLRQARPRSAPPKGRPGWLGLWRQTAVAWAAQLALPKPGVRL